MDNDLLSRFLSGQASDEEVGRLRAEIDRDPAALQDLYEAAELERDLAEVFKSRTAVVVPRRRWFLLTAAAAMLLAVAGYFIGTPREIARVDKVEGLVLRNGSPLSADDRVYPGDRIEAQGRVVLRYDDGTTLDLAAGTKTKEFAAEGGKRLVLDQGSLRADVAKQPANQPLLIRTPEGEARVLGTRFTLSVATGTSRLEVEKGLVRLTRLADGKSTDVGAGQTSVALATGSWHAVPGTRMDAVTPDMTRFPAIRGISGPAAVIGAWSGGAFDTSRGRLVVWGGGYSDYAGNELYAFALDSMTWQRLTDPTASPRLSEEENADGTPTSRATYNGLAYVPRGDRLFAVGGARAGNGFACRIPWSFDFGAKQWSKRAVGPPGALGGSAAYDPATRKLWWADGTGMYSLDVDADRWTKHNSDDFYYVTGTIDPKRGLWILVGNGKVTAVDVRSGAPLPQVWKTTGGDALVSKHNPGVDYDPVRDRISAWAGGAVYSLDPETKMWTATDAPGAPSATPNGIYGRWRYAPAVDAFIVVTAIDQNVHLFKPAK